MFSARFYRPLIATVRYRRANKVYDPKWAHLRAKKFFKTKCPDYDEMLRRQNLPADQVRRELKKRGVLPSRHYQPPMDLNCSFMVQDPFRHEFYEGKFSELGSKAKELTKPVWSYIRKPDKSHINSIERQVNGFRLDEFATQAHDIYVAAHEALTKWKPNDDDSHYNLLGVVTEKAYGEMVAGLQRRTLRWSFVESIEPPQVVRVRAFEHIQPGNEYGQITIRFHTSQLLSIYDQFGRLMFGSESLSKQILEYCVFERWLAADETTGAWRLHAKIVEQAAPPKPADVVVESVEPWLHELRKTLLLQPLKDDRHYLTHGLPKPAARPASDV